MKRYELLLTVFVVGCILFSQAGCQGQAGPPPEPKPPVTEPKPPATEPKPPVPEPQPPTVSVPPKRIPEPEKKGPRITFEKVAHDFGKVRPGSKHSCEFKFTNTGDSVLKVKKPTSSCSCTIAKLSKQEYAPGESGLVKVTKYRVPEHQGVARQPVYVSSNDKVRPKVKLTIKATVVTKVAHEPKELKLLLKDENAGCPEIRLTSLDGQPFAIKSFRATTRGITADYDASLKATSHVIQPKINTEKLRNRSRGSITIRLTHPECNKITIPFDVLPQFKLQPPSIILFDAEPEKAIPKVVWLLNNYGEDFEVESVSSEKNIIKVLSQERVGKRYKFELEITPPADKSKKIFSDVFRINIKGGKKLKINCSGFYTKDKENP